MRRRSNKTANIKLRFNIATTIVYIVGIILLLQLFNLQIIHGKEYREESNTRLTRESTLKATRGSITDRSGNVIATDSMGFRLDLYKSKLDNDALNESILKIVQVLESNQDSYTDNFPISINPFNYTISDTRLAQFKKDNKIDENASAEEAFYVMKEKYGITNDSIEDTRKIMTIRYNIATQGYSNTKAVTLADSISRESALVFNERSAEFPGINVVVQPVRSYPSGSLAAHIVGYTGKINEDELKTRKDTYTADDTIGKTGIESVFEEYLKGQDGTKQIDMTVDGTVTEEYVTEEAVKGSDVVLTIDANLQKVTEEALANNINKIRSGGFSEQYDAIAGSAIVMNVKNGEILALANYPTYNPQDFVGTMSTDTWNRYFNSEEKPLYNIAIQGSYAPGSIFKMVTAIAGLETNAITTKETINDTGVYYLGDGQWRCWYYTDYHRGHGRLNVTGAIQKSCNYFFYETGNRMGIDNLVRYAKYFGLGTKTGVELPSETAGTLASQETKAAKENGASWYPGDTLNAAIGQGYNSFSPLQMTKYISMVANGGNAIDPTVIKTIIKPDGSEVSKEEIKQFSDQKLGITEDDSVEELTIKQENIVAVKEGMRSVAMEQGGTAYSIFRNFNIEVGGKTGSAEAGNKVNAWFAGFAPFDDPEIAVVVFVENGGHGNYTAEAVRDIMAQYFGMNTNQVQEDMTAVPYTEIAR